MRKTRVARGRRAAGRRRTQRGGNRYAAQWSYQGTDYRGQGDNDLTTIARSAADGNLGKIQELIERKTTRFYKDEIRAGLHPAAANGHVLVLEYLLSLPGVFETNRQGRPIASLVDEKGVSYATSRPSSFSTSPLQISKRHPHAYNLLKQYSLDQHGGARRRRRTRRKHQRRRV